MTKYTYWDGGDPNDPDPDDKPAIYFWFGVIFFVLIVLMWLPR